MPEDIHIKFQNNTITYRLKRRRKQIHFKSREFLTIRRRCNSQYSAPPLVDIVKFPEPASERNHSASGNTRVNGPSASCLHRISVDGDALIHNTCITTCVLLTEYFVLIILTNAPSLLSLTKLLTLLEEEAKEKERREGVNERKYISFHASTRSVKTTLYRSSKKETGEK